MSKGDERLREGKARAPMRALLRVVGWNVLLLVAGVGTAACVAELWLRHRGPFMTISLPVEYVPNVGYLRKPNTQMRYTNRQDFWTVERTNAQGFVDRERPSPEQAAAGCHVAVIGDSFVEANEVPIDAKFHVVLERLAASALPSLQVTTSAYGRADTGQIQQLPYYDEYARQLSPKLLVLVFVDNDFVDNAPVLRALAAGLGQRGWDPEHLPGPSAERRPDGTMVLRPPDPDHEKFRLARSSGSRLARGVAAASGSSWLVLYLRANGFRRLLRFDPGDDFGSWVDQLRQRPRYAPLLEGWRPTSARELTPTFAQSELPPLFQDALDYTAFALGEFKSRADRDGTAIVVLASHRIRTYGPSMFDRMSEIAATLDIPVVDQAEYILRQGASLEDARWPRDAHWNPDGHRWAAEALLEYLASRQHLCND